MLAELDETASATAGDDVTSFLSGQHRADDLLFRIGPARWIIVLPMAESEITAFLERVEQAFGEANRNRLGGPLPEIHWKILGAWGVSFDHDEILSRLSAAIEPKEAVYA